MSDPVPARAPRRFRLLRFYTVATLAVFTAAFVALFLLQRGEESFFGQAQREQRALFARAQAELAGQNESAVRRSLLAVHESSHVNLTQLVANTMWAGGFAPIVAAAQRLPIDACRALPGDAEPSAPRRACLSELGLRIRALPGFAALDRRAYAAMSGSSVFKIKVFDLRGLTVYSSEHAQIGEDGAGNAGWKSAAAGQPASELTHRERFSAFERVVENRDLISTYVPVRVEPKGPVIGVFELYSDVTPFLGQIQTTTKAFADNIAANEARVGEVAAAKQREVMDNSSEFLIIVGGLLTLLYGTSLAIVRFGQRIIDRQQLAQEQASARELLWHREKMAALAAMSAHVSHEVGNPLAVIAGVAQDLPVVQDGAPSPRQTILEQTGRIAAMMRKMAQFAAAGSAAPETVDINPMIEAVCEFQRFDPRFRRTPIEFVPGDRLPACVLVPDHLNEVMMNLLQACAAAGEPEGTQCTLGVATRASGSDVYVEVDWRDRNTGTTQPIGHVAADPRCEPARRRLADMGGRLEAGEMRLRIVLSAAA